MCLIRCICTQTKGMVFFFSRSTCPVLVQSCPMTGIRIHSNAWYAMNALCVVYFALASLITPRPMLHQCAHAGGSFWTGRVESSGSSLTTFQYPSSPGQANQSRARAGLQPTSAGHSTRHLSKQTAQMRAGSNGESQKQGRY